MVLSFTAGSPNQKASFESNNSNPFKRVVILVNHPEEMMARGPIKMLYVIGKEFTGFQLEALADDTVFGLMHWHDFSHIAVVTDHGWVNALVNMFKPFFHGKVRLFRLAELPVAKDWITKARVGARP